MEVKNINNNNIPISGIKECRTVSIEKCDKTSCAKKSGRNVSFGRFEARRTIRKGLQAISKGFSSPQQRAILGITALCTQPFIDLYNSHIKKEDKPITVAKTISKIVVGTTIGIIMRHYAIKAIKNFTKSTYSGKYSQLLMPKKIIEKLKNKSKDITEANLNNYRNGLGTFIGTMCGLITNFTIDAPLSKKMTNLLYEKCFKKEEANGK